jgi:hypothetical protein
MKKIIQTLFLAFATQAAFSQTNCQAAFTYYNDSAGSTVYLYDQSYNTDSTTINITNYTWTVEFNGSTNTYTNANPVVPTNGVNSLIIVCLTINTINGCTSSFCDTINPWQSCYAYWIYGNIGFSYYFADGSQPGSPTETINSRYWEITDHLNNIIFTSTQQNPSFSFPDSGIYEVCLSISTDSGCTSTSCNYIGVYDTSYPAVCNAYFVGGANPLMGTYDFYDASTPGDSLGLINSWYWEVTDSLNNFLFSSIQQNPSFVIPDPGYYEVCLTIATDSACTDMFCQYIVVYDTSLYHCQLYVNPQITNVSVLGGNDGAIDLTVYGGTFPYIYSWNTGAITQDISGLPSGFYTVTIGQADTSCPAYTYTFQINEPYDTIPLDTLYAPTIDTCLNFVPDSFYVTLYSVDSSLITVTWVFVGQGMTQTITVQYTYQNYGPCVILLTIDCGIKNLTTYMAHININISFGINEMMPEDIKIYPNPVSNSFSIEMPAGSANTTIQVYNSLGQLMTTDAIGNNAKATIDASQWPAGIYVVRLSDGQGQYITRNIVKQ